MSETCPGCFTSAKGQNAEKERVRKLAKDYAIKNDVSVAIYRDMLTFRFMEVNKALELNLAIMEVISKYN